MEKSKEKPQERIFANSELLCTDLASKHKEVILSFSCGKDAIASMIQMKRYFDKVHLVFYYLVPDLEFQLKQIAYYEQVFGQRITQMPNPKFYNMLAGLTFQPLPNALNLIKKGFCDLSLNFDDVFNMAKADLSLHEDTYTALGVRASDSLNRYTSIKQHGAVNTERKQFFPIFDWNLAKTLKEIKDANIKLPIDYKIWGRSFDGLDYRFVKGVKDNFPNDYQKIKDFFPLIDLEIMRYEK